MSNIGDMTPEELEKLYQEQTSRAMVVSASIRRALELGCEARTSPNTFSWADTVGSDNKTSPPQSKSTIKYAKTSPRLNVAELGKVPRDRN